MENSAPRRFADFLAAFNLDRFGAGRHIIRDERGWRIRDIQAEYLWIATIRPSFCSPCFLALLKTPEGFQGVAAIEGDDGLPLSVSEPIFMDIPEDPIFTCLEKNRLEVFGGGISLDGVAYTLSVRSFGGDFDISFSNPRSGGLSSLADALWLVAGHFETHFPLLHEVISYGHEYKYIKNGEQAVTPNA
jgi:hypothetical protein